MFFIENNFKFNNLLIFSNLTKYNGIFKKINIIQIEIYLIVGVNQIYVVVLYLFIIFFIILYYIYHNFLFPFLIFYQ